jgi:hypothetical protein
MTDFQLSGEDGKDFVEALDALSREELLNVGLVLETLVAAYMEVAEAKMLTGDKKRTVH